MEWEVVIGLEIHAQLRTKSKIFSSASTAFGAEPNTQACAVDLGLPGVLPVVNYEAVNMAIRFGLAIDAEITRKSIFARKNYFYPDLPKGYQISQMDHPIVGIGHIDIDMPDGTVKKVGVTRAHLEEDAGKSIHGVVQGSTGVDLNRAGTPLLEIVSEPDMRSAKEAIAYMKKIHAIVRYIDICDGNMQEGSFRCDANVSVRKFGAPEYGTRAEVKNLNSFKFIERAINIEVERQIEVIESGGTVVQETRLYNPDADETRSMRSKEEANDYRYFPDPDLLPVVVDEEWIESVRKTLPELPDEKKKRFVDALGLKAEDAITLTASRSLAEFFEAVMEASGGEAKLSSNWVMVQLMGRLNKEELKLADCPLSAEQIGGIIKRIADDTIPNKIGRQVFDIMWEEGGDADAIIEQKGLKPMNDTGAIEQIIDDIIANNTAQVEQYRSGKDKVFGFFVGQVMKATKGKANPKTINEMLKAKLKQD
ncbi:MAG: Asp-tRNA(Asn)/Glu-tRNA(Gln) amidotransferase subunit GatB [Methylococcales bacterium]|jgi:aspartyl-tRNA(Asn)/glutamyl-tRNA(Gln) amidotransferase subunit B|nr:Asp-tRNA(Asn)/Glu-tRNA(Gln) amidotransferase subunit GatB [Methylococcales bacterium]MBT7442639.1 Asp-tRNA(Asn)/Glu-tRNA(Gln) amidotransferase subunit GatB [Methylococcales bacterium]